MNVEQRQVAADPQTKPPDLGCESIGSYRLQPPSPFIIITQPESWYSFTVIQRVEGWVDLHSCYTFAEGMRFAEYPSIVTSLLFKVIIF